MYDVIVVGARCAGSPTAMLLARQGYRVLLVDKATFPSDTISAHGILYRGRSWLAHERPLSARKARPMSREGWEAIWSSGRIPERYASFAPPNSSVVAWATGLPAGAQVLDLGCGVGRHVTYLGGLGFKMAGSDISATGVQLASAACAERGISFDGQVCPMTSLPWPDNTFDAALSTSTIHHALRADIQRALAEVWRILKPGGQFLVDFPDTGRGDYGVLRAEAAAGRIREVEPNTFVDERPDSDDPDGFLPHHFCDEADVRDLLRRFTLDQLVQDPRDGFRGKWVAWARKPK
jgi:SAM-dependent methyltransferase